MKRIISIFLAFLCVFCLISCDIGSSKKEETTNNSSTDEESNKKVEHTHILDEKGKCKLCEAMPYSLSYVSNGDGTCYVDKITTYPDYKQEYILEIPEKSPHGDTVVEVRAQLVDNVVPQIFLKEDFENMCVTLKEKLGDDIYGEYMYGKIRAYYIGSDQANTEVLETYPVGKILDVYMLDPHASSTDHAYILEFFKSYCVCSLKDVKMYYENVHIKLEEISMKNKKEILSSLPQLPTSLSDGITSVITHKTLQKIDISLYGKCFDLKQLVIPDCIVEIPAYAFFGFSKLQEVVISDSVTSIGENAFFNCDVLRSVTFKNTTGWLVNEVNSDLTESIDVTDSEKNARTLKKNANYKWKRVK